MEEMFMKKLIAIATLLIGTTFGGFAPSVALAEPQTYKFDPSHTEVIFSYQHLGMSRAFGQFKKVTGNVKMDKVAPAKSSVDVAIDVNSIDTGVKEFDKHLRGKDFFNSAKFPQIKFKSTKVQKVSGKKFKVAGNLTIKGKTKPVVLDMTYIIDQPHPLGKFNPQYKDVHVAAFSARTSVKRSDFGMGLFVPMTGDKVDIIIETEMFRQ